jgi:hypothetical protein
MLSRLWKVDGRTWKPGEGEAETFAQNNKTAESPYFLPAKK